MSQSVTCEKPGLIELADKLLEEYGETHMVYRAISNTLGYPPEETTRLQDVERLCEAIKAGANNCFPYPLDKDGIPCKIGDILIDSRGHVCTVTGFSYESNEWGLYVHYDVFDSDGGVRPANVTHCNRERIKTLFDDICQAVEDYKRGNEFVDCHGFMWMYYKQALALGKAVGGEL